MEADERLLKLLNGSEFLAPCSIFSDAWKYVFFV